MTRPLGWSMIHMLTGITTSRFFSLGRDGTSAWRGNGPNLPLVVQYALTCGAWEKADGTRPSIESNATDTPSFLISPLLERVATDPPLLPRPMTRAGRRK